MTRNQKQMSCTGKFKLIVLGIILVSSVATAQKNRPVADDAMILMDLMFADSYAIDDPRTREETIRRNRLQVINILKNYTTQEDLAEQFEKDKDLDKDITYNGVSVDEDKFDRAISKTCGLQNLNALDLDNAQCLIVKLSDQISAKNSVIRNIYNNSVTLQLTAGDLSPLTEMESSIDTLQSLRDSVYYLQHKYELRILLQIFKKRKNPYLEEITFHFLKKYQAYIQFKKDEFALSSGGSSIQKSLPIVGGIGLSFTDAIDGLSRFIAKRFKEELTTQVVSKIQIALSDTTVLDNFAELKALLPETTRFLIQLQPEQYAAALESLKSKVELDLNHLLKNLPELEKTYRVQRILNKNQELRLAVEGMRLIHELSQANHPLDYISNLESSKLMGEWKSSDNPKLANLSNAVDLMAMLAFAMSIDQSDGRTWVHREVWQKYSSRTLFYKTFLGLLQEQDRLHYRITFGRGNPSSFYEKISGKFNEVEEIKVRIDPEISKFMVQAERLNNLIKEIKKTKRQGGKLSNDSIHVYINTTIDFLEQSMIFTDSLVSIVGGDTLNVGKRYSKFMAAARKSSDIFLEISRKSYANAISNSLDLYFSMNTDKDVIKLDDFRDRLVKGARNLDAHEEISKVKEVYASINTSFTTENADQLIAFVKTLIKNDQQLFLSIRSIGVPGADIQQASSQWTTFQTLNTELKKTDIKQKYAEQLIDFKDVIGDLNNIISGNGDISVDFVKKFNGFINTTLSDEQEKLIGLIESIETVPANIDQSYKNKVKALLEYLIRGDGVPIILEEVGLREAWEQFMTLKNLFESRKEYLDINKNKKETLSKLFGNSIESMREILSKTNSTDALADLDSCLKKMAKERFKEFINRAGDKVDDKTREEIVKIVNFLSAIAKAENAEDAEKAISAIALPPGSSIIKRKSRFNLAINSYPGIFSSYERLIGGKETIENPGSFSMSFTAPVGTAISFGTRRQTSWSIFVPFIDIGAFTSVRFSDDNTELPEINFKNIFAPGLHIIYGLKNSPLSIGGGMQYGPILREIQTVDPDLDEDMDGNPDVVINERSSWRIGITLTMDIPMFNLYTRSR